MWLICVGGFVVLGFAVYGFIERFDINTKGEYQVNYKCPTDYDTREEYLESLENYYDNALEKTPGITEEELFQERTGWFTSMGCEQGQWTTQNNEVQIDSETSKIMKVIKKLEAEQPARITGNETLEELYNNPYIKHIRTALNGYLDGSNIGTEDAIALSENGWDKLGFSNFDRSYYQSKFFIYSAADNDYGGVQVYIVFVDKPDTIFWVWVYQLGGDGSEYSLRGFCETGPPEEKRTEFTKIMRSLIESGERSQHCRQLD